MSIKNSSSSDQNFAPLGDRGIDPGYLLDVADRIIETDGCVDHHWLIVVADKLRASGAELTELRETNKRLNRRCQIAEAAANLRAEEWDKRSKGAGRAYIYGIAKYVIEQEFKAKLDQHAADLATLRSERDKYRQRWINPDGSPLDPDEALERVSKLPREIKHTIGPLIRVAIMHEREQREAAEADLATLRAQVEQWQPIETAPKDGTVILRPHTIWGAMDVRYQPTTLADGKLANWINGDYTTGWPDEAFLPFWRPLPPPP